MSGEKTVHLAGQALVPSSAPQPASPRPSSSATSSSRMFRCTKDRPCPVGAKLSPKPNGADLNDVVEPCEVGGVGRVERESVSGRDRGDHQIGDASPRRASTRARGRAYAAEQSRRFSIERYGIELGFSSLKHLDTARPFSDRTGVVADHKMWARG